MNPESYIIVGSGVFGASAALELARCKPGAHVMLVDVCPIPNPSAASSDVNKIIRADYRDPLYTELAIDALQYWKFDPLYRPYFHETGMLFAESEGKGPAALHNLQSLGAADGARLMTVDEARLEFPVLADANWSDVESAYYNPSSGWAAADPALAAVVKEALGNGVKLLTVEVARLLLEKRETEFGLRWLCKGIITCDNEPICADRVLLCAGAATAKILAESAPKDPMLHANGRVTAAAALQFAVRVPPTKWATCIKAPVFANLMPHTCGEAIPMNDSGVIKLNYERSFTNYEYHPPSGQMISQPSPAVGGGRWTIQVPQTLVDEAANILRNTYGPSSGDFEIQGYRICWDSITPNQDWIISPHNNCDSLYIAGGGSFHAFKFLPVLGREIVAMLDGKLDDLRAGRWKWFLPSKTDQGACDSYWPKRDLKDILLASEARIKSRA